MSVSAACIQQNANNNDQPTHIQQPSPTKNNRKNPNASSDRERAKSRPGLNQPSPFTSLTTRKYEQDAISSSSSLRTQQPTPSLRRSHSSRERPPKRPLLRSNNSTTSVKTISPAHSLFRRTQSKEDDLGAMSSSSASSSSLEEPPLPPTASQPTSRKVAASLQLFKETDSPAKALEHSPCVSDPHLQQDKRIAPSRDNSEEVSEAQFVKRAEWPDREGATIRRDKSIAAQARTREAKPETSITSNGERRLTGSSPEKADIPRTLSRGRALHAHGEIFLIS